MAQPLPVGVRDDGALVADDGLVEGRRLEEPAHRLHHPSGDDDHVETGGACGAQRVHGPRAQLAVPHERAVEIGRDDLNVAGEVVGKRERQPDGLPPVAFTT